MLEIRHIELSEANAYVTENHRHHKAVCGHRFSLACYADGRLCGVAIVGRPRSRRIDQYTTVEVLRLCTDGTKNACSKLYGACGRFLEYAALLAAVCTVILFLFFLAGRMRRHFMKRHGNTAVDKN